MKIRKKYNIKGYIQASISRAQTKRNIRTSKERLSDRHMSERCDKTMTIMRFVVILIRILTVSPKNFVYMKNVGCSPSHNTIIPEFPNSPKPQVRPPNTSKYTHTDMHPPIKMYARATTHVVLNYSKRENSC